MVFGLGGNVLTMLEKQSIETGAFRFVQKIQSVEQLTEIPDSVEQETELTRNSFLRNSVEQVSYFIHPQINRLLEVPLIPDKIEIPSIELIAPIKIADFNFTDLEGETFGQWIAPSEFAAAWHPNSALIGQFGNTVINGHHNEFGKVFGKLVNLESGDMIYIYTKGKKYPYIVANKMILLEKGQPVDVRTANAEWLGETDDERLTLVTCWPQKSNTHRLIIVARPYQ